MTRFNSYMSHIDTAFFKQLCIQSGTLHHLTRHSYLFREGEVWPYWGFVKQGILKYSCFNQSEQKYYNVGFSFEHAFTLAAGGPAEVHVGTGSGGSSSDLPWNDNVAKKHTSVKRR